MALITLTIPDSVMPRVIDALCDANHRPDDSPLTKPQFAKQQVINYVKGVVRQYESRVARDVAGAAADTKAESEVVIT